MWWFGFGFGGGFVCLFEGFFVVCFVLFHF